MAISTFPTYLVPLFENTRVTQARRVQRTEFEAGPARVRAAARRYMTTRELTFKACSKADLASFNVWVDVTLSGGSGEFLFRDSFDGKNKRARIKDAAVEIEALQFWHGQFSIKMTLEIWEGGAS
jgi:hypothetical protein